MDSSNGHGPTRRETLAGATAFLATAPAFAEPASAQARAAYAYVGSFTSAERKARGNGINVYRIETNTGA